MVYGTSINYKENANYKSQHLSPRFESQMQDTLNAQTNTDSKLRKREKWIFK